MRTEQHEEEQPRPGSYHTAEGTLYVGQKKSYSRKSYYVNGHLVISPYIRKPQRRRPAEVATSAFVMVAGSGLYIVLHSWFSHSWIPYITGSIVGLLMGGLLLSSKIRKRSHAYSSSLFAGLSARSLTNMAALLAGRRRLGLRQEWVAHLAGEDGHDQASWQKVKQAFGFLVSAVRFRLSDTSNAAWTPIDAILRSRTLSNLCVIIPTTAASSLVLRHEGMLGVITSAESFAAITATLYAVIRTGRWWRNVKPPEPKARRPKENH